MATFNKLMQALQIVQEVAGVLGLPVPTIGVTNPSDITTRQMIALLRNVGRKLCKPTNGHRWQCLTRTWALATVPAQTLYALPDDWDSFQDATGWNTSSRLPMLGPADNSQWQCLKARAIGPTTLSVVYRTIGNQFELYNSPSSPQALSIVYTSRAWVQDENTPTPPITYKDAPTKDGDIILFDAELVQAGVKLAFLTAKGFDTTAASGEYNELLEAAMNADQDAPILSCTPASQYPLISVPFSVPDTGYGL